MWPTTDETDNYTSTVASSLRVTDGLWYQPLPDPLADYSPSIESYIPDELRLRDISANRSLRAFRATMYSPNGVVLVVEELNPTNWPELGSSVLAYLGVTRFPGFDLNWLWGLYVAQRVGQGFLYARIWERGGWKDIKV